MISQDIESLLRTATTAHRPTSEEMVKVLRYAADQLTEVMNSGVACDDRTESAQAGFARAWIYSPSPQLGIISITWRGIIVGYLRQDTPGIAVWATLFCYSNRLKLQTKTGHSFFDLAYDYCEEQATFHWQPANGWCLDMYKEYPEFDEDRK